MMLDGALNVRESSRLTCQIVVRPELHGLVLRLPESQF
jgi:2Fe-2S ferredoxin